MHDRPDPSGPPQLLPAQPAWEPGPRGSLLVRAPAKLNLCLRVGPPRSDGYHPLDSLVAKVTLYDELILAPLPDGQLELHCDCPAAGPAPTNLALRAARLLREHVRGGQELGARIEVRKHIPVAAGLGGGSSDAAAALTGLNRLWNIGLSQSELVSLAAALGSDVPLFLAGPVSRMQGRGEVLCPVSGLGPFWAVLVCPPLSCPTAAVYAAYDQAGGGRLEDARPELLSGRPVEDWPALLPNDLFGPACRVCPGLTEWADRLGRAVHRPVQMTGSGSTLFVLAGGPEAAQAAHAQLGTELSRHARLVALNPW